MASAPPSPDATANPRSNPPPINPNYRPPPYQKQSDYKPPQQSSYPAPQQQPYYQGGYPQPPQVIEVIEQPFADPFRPREVIIMEEPPYPQRFQATPIWERQPLQPSSNVGKYEFSILEL